MNHDSTLVPLAERPHYVPPPSETARETIWYNATDEDIKLEVYVGHGQVLPNPRNLGRALTREEQTATRTYVIRAKDARAIPSEFDQAIQKTQCLEPECSQKPLACKDTNHRWLIIGGLCPVGLQRRGLQHRPVLAPGLDDVAAKEQAAKDKAINALVARDKGDEELLMAKLELEELRAQKAKLEEALATREAAEKHTSDAARQESGKPKK